MAALAEFERDLLRERVRSGIAAARAGVVFGRRPRQRVKSDRFAPKVLKLVSESQSYREISHRLGLSKIRFSISSNVTVLRNLSRRWLGGMSVPGRSDREKCHSEISCCCRPCISRGM